jgi:hypothetical protein
MNQSKINAVDAKMESALLGVAVVLPKWVVRANAFATAIATIHTTTNEVTKLVD